MTLNFAGLIHDHSVLNEEGQLELQSEQQQLCSAIAILRRHPMYDCLILVKKFRHCLNGYTLEFPLDKVQESELEPTNESPMMERQKRHQDESENKLGPVRAATCNGRRLVSRFLDGDDPIFGACCGHSISAACKPGACVNQTGNSNGNTNQTATRQQQAAPDSPFIEQRDERNEPCELVHVPVNGLLDRLAAYTNQGISVDGRVYAFAMGLKTAERIISTKSQKELQETPI